jgi:starch synthase (maltosyl-transferring)
MEHTPREPGSEEYLNSEKYEIKKWDRDRPGNLRELITRLNAIRRDNPALQRDWNLRFHPTDNDQLLCYSKKEGDNLILVAVNLDPVHTQSGFVDFDRAPSASYELHDLVAAGHYTWSGRRNFVQLNPHTLPAHVFRVTRK